MEIHQNPLVFHENIFFLVPNSIFELTFGFFFHGLTTYMSYRSYVKLSSAVGAILVEGPNRRTHFWKRTIQRLFHQNLVLIEQMVSEKKIFMGISHRVLC